MERHRWFSGWVAAAIAACTYNEYNTYNQVRPGDAGVPSALAGAGGGGASGAAGTSGAGAGGDTDRAGAGGTGGAGPNCTGCLRLTMSSNAARNLRLALDGDQNLSQTQVVWRMRVRDFTGNVGLNFYAQSGDSADEQVFLTSVSLSGSSGWQDVGADFGALQPFSLPAFIDAGGAAGGGFDPGFPFDKSEVEQIGVIIQPDVPGGVFTPLTVEIDSVTFSNRTELDAALSSSDDSFELIEADGTSIDGAALVHIAG